MNYQMHFDPYLIEHFKGREEELLREAEALHLKERLREDREPLDPRSVALARRGMMSLLRAARGAPRGVAERSCGI